ncbi:MAG: hypothetical protein ACJA08_002262 [Cyclobacteriaceae bacterium]|jgi:hypothetical protein
MIPLNNRTHSRMMSLMTIIAGVSCIFITQALKGQGFSTIGSIIIVVIVYLLFFVMIKRSKFFAPTLERTSASKLSVFRAFFKLRFNEVTYPIKDVDKVTIKRYGHRELNIYLVLKDESTILLNTFRRKEQAMAYEQLVKQLIAK